MASLAATISFTGKRALVTGAGSGIGREIVKSLIASNCEKVYALCKSNDVHQLSADHPDIVDVHQVDLTDWSAVGDILSRKVTRVDYVVNNAGIVDLQPVGAISQQNLESHFAVNVNAAVNVSQICAQKMIDLRQGSGSIVNVSSQASTVALSGHLSYCASKAALDAVTRVMALELGPHNIRVNSVRPTVTMTDMAVKAWSDPSKANIAKQRIPLGRFAQPQVRFW